MSRRNKITKELSAQHLAFVEAYVSCLNGVQAYMTAYPNASYNAALVGSSRLLTDDNVKKAVAKRIEERGTMSKEEIIQRWEDQARATLFPFVRIDSDGFAYFNFSDPQAKNYFHLIKKLRTRRERRTEGRGINKEEWEGEWVEIELHDPQKALEMLTKIHKIYEDPGTNVNVLVIGKMSNDERLSRLAAIFEQARNRRNRPTDIGD